MAGTQRKNRRTTIVINKGFQTRYAAMAALGAIVAVNIVLIAGFLLYQKELAPVVTTTHTLAIGVAELLLVMAVYYFGIRASFRVAGPMFALARGLSQLGAGDLTVRLHFRDRDCCQDIAESFNANVAKVEDRVESIKRKLGENLDRDLTVDAYRALIKELWNELCFFNTKNQ